MPPNFLQEFFPIPAVLSPPPRITHQQLQAVLVPPEGGFGAGNSSCPFGSFGSLSAEKASSSSSSKLAGDADKLASPAKHLPGQISPLDEADELPVGLLTPKRPRGGSDVASIRSWPHLSPSPKAVNMATPEVTKRSTDTPPSSPALLQKRLSADISAALSRGSYSLLSLSLLRGHRCGQDHCVFEAVRRQNLAALEFLLEHGSPDFDEPCCGRRPLHAAVQACLSKGDTGYQMIRMLLHHGARPNPIDGDAADVSGPLHDAALRGCASVVSLLLESGADPNALDGNGNTPLHALVRRAPFHGGAPHLKAMNLLISHGAKPSTPDASGFPAITYAQAPAIRQCLLQAAQWWSHRALLLALGPARDTSEASEQAGLPPLPGEVLKAIACCL